MKLNKLICSLMVGGSLSFSLSSCVPNVGDDNDSTRSGNNSYTTSTVPKLVVQNSQENQTDIRSNVDYYGVGMMEAAFDLPKGPLKFISKVAFNKLLTAIFGEKKDPVIEQLKEMDKKLDKIGTDLRHVLDVSTSTSSTLSRFFTAISLDNLQSDFNQVHNFSLDIRVKYQRLSGGNGSLNLFGAGTPQDLEALYNYAKSVDIDDRNSPAIYKALEASRNSNLNNNKRLQSNIDTSTGDLLNLFVGKFGKSNNSSALLEKIKGNKQVYLAALGSNLSVNQDFFNRITQYNGQLLITKSEIFGSLQELYNIQLAQLAYLYAHNMTIAMVGVTLSNEAGLAGFKKSVENLNMVYKPIFENIKLNVKNTLSPINDEEVYTLLDGAFENSGGRHLLNKNSFVYNIEQTKVTPGTCTISGFTFNNVKDRTGVATLSARCLQAYNSSNQAATFVNTSIDIPYVMNGAGKITNYAVAGIYYDLQSKQLKSDAQTGTTTTDLKDTDINNLCNVGKDDVGRNWNTIKAADNQFFTLRPYHSSGRDYRAFEIKFDSNSYLYPVKYTNNKDTTMAGLPTKNWSSVDSGGYASMVNAQSEFISVANSPSRDTRVDSYVALAGGKAFCVRLQAYHSDAHSEKARMEFGVYGLAGDATRASAKNLVFNNHNSIKIEGSINKEGEFERFSSGDYETTGRADKTLGKGNWSITTSLAVESSEVVKLKL